MKIKRQISKILCIFDIEYIYFVNSIFLSPFITGPDTSNSPTRSWFFYLNQMSKRYRFEEGLQKGKGLVWDGVCQFLPVSCSVVRDYRVKDQSEMSHFSHLLLIL